MSESADQSRVLDFQDGAWDGIEQACIDLIQKARDQKSVIVTMREGGQMPDGTVPTSSTLSSKAHDIGDCAREMIVLAERLEAINGFAEGG